MIKKLKKKMVWLVTLSMLALMTILVSAINVINYVSVVDEADETLEVLALTDETFGMGGPTDPFGMGLPQGMSPEVPYEARYFTVMVNSEGTVLDRNVEQIVSVSGEETAQYVEKALADDNESGFIGNFRYRKIQDEMKTRIIFLDLGRKLASFRRFMLTSILIGLGGCVIVFVAFLLFAGRIIRPISESYEKQKRFITDAGHEIKTPLTIISANLDLLESDAGDKECLSDIRQQTGRLRNLTQELVYLSKMEEENTKQEKIEFPLSDMVAETVSSFRGPVASQNKEMTENVAEGLTYKGAPESIRRLISVLMENAVKYCPENGNIHVTLESQKHSVLFEIRNSSDKVYSAEELGKLFDRFFRTDASRNSETGGAGIGLSIAKAIVEAHGGKITASCEENSFVMRVVLPF